MIQLSRLVPDVAITEKRLREHLAQALQQERAIYPDRTTEPKREDIIVRAMIMLYDIERRMSEKERNNRYRSPWPAFQLSDEEREAAYEAMRSHSSRGLVTLDEEEIFMSASPQEVSRYHDVITVFRACCVGRNPKFIGRDWSMLNMLVVGVSARGIGRKQKPQLSARNVNQRCLLQKQAIAYQLRMYFP